MKPGKKSAGLADEVTGPLAPGVMAVLGAEGRRMGEELVSAFGRFKVVDPASPRTGPS